MNIGQIKNGIVLDHITAGKAMRLYELLKLDKINDCQVAIIKNAESKKMGRKDIIKIDKIINLDFDVLGYVDPNVTVNIIKDSEISEVIKIDLPEKITNVIKCKNPRCITTVEQELPQVFVLSDKNKRTYRCLYCETLFEE